MAIPFILPAISAVATAVASLGPTVASFATTVLSALSPYLRMGFEVLQKVIQVADFIGLGVGLLKPGENLNMMGERALHAADAGITPEQFKTHEEYFDALRQHPLNPDKKFDPLSTAVAGLAVLSSGLDERFGLSEGTIGKLWPLVAADDAYFTGQKVLQLVQSGQSVADVVSYFLGELGGAESLHVEDALVKMDQTIHPQESDDVLRHRIYQAQTRCENPGEVADSE